MCTTWQSGRSFKIAAFASSNGRPTTSGQLAHYPFSARPYLFFKFLQGFMIHGNTNRRKKDRLKKEVRWDQ